MHCGMCRHGPNAISIHSVHTLQVKSNVHRALQRMRFLLVVLLFLMPFAVFANGCEEPEKENMSSCDIRLFLCRCRCEDLEVNTECLKTCDAKGETCKEMELTTEQIDHPKSKLRGQGNRR